MTEELVPVAIDRVRRRRDQAAGDKDEGKAVVDLAAIDGRGVVHIGVRDQEGVAIALALSSRSTPRPMTHDLLSQTVEAFGGAVDRVVIRYQSDPGIFTADLVLTRAGDATSIDCRPSDALALAVRCDPRPELLVEASLFDPSR